MWADIIGVVLKATLSFFKDWLTSWYTEAKAKTDEWNAKTFKAQLESVVEADKIEVKIRDAKPTTVPETPMDWNKPRVVPVLLLPVLLAASLFLQGCFVRYVTVPDKKPIIDVLERPVLEETPPFTDREKKLVKYAVELETKIDTYNKWAHTQNIEHGYAPKPEAKDPQPDQPKPTNPTENNDKPDSTPGPSGR